MSCSVAAPAYSNDETSDATETTETPVTKESEESEESDYQVRDTTSHWPEAELPDYLKENPYRVSLFDPQNGEDSERLWSQTKLIVGLGFGVAGFISLLPSDVSNWEDTDEGPLEKWWNNVRAGPVWDEDEWDMNYLGHPYFGGVYYQVARKSGYSQWDSFVYSFLMSTFFWEYGLESFAEVPSIQDIVVTPIGGWLWGEFAYQSELSIRNQGGTVYGSELLGDVTLFFLDPVDSIGVGINKLAGAEVIKAGSAWISAKPATNLTKGKSTDLYWSFNVVYQF
ncbi:MAG: DUF3943 domain-containing protein [Pseudomonadales bacterium]|nr:DUF3943 domain-containing protein [Pseudomonadales bacterium]